MPKQRTFQEPKVKVGVSIHARVIERLDALAADNKRPRSYYIERAVTKRYAADLWDEVDAA